MVSTVLMFEFSPSKSRILQFVYFVRHVQQSAGRLSRLGPVQRRRVYGCAMLQRCACVRAYAYELVCCFFFTGAYFLSFSIHIFLAISHRQHGPAVAFVASRVVRL